MPTLSSLGLLFSSDISLGRSQLGPDPEDCSYIETPLSYVLYGKRLQSLSHSIVGFFYFIAAVTN